MHVSIRISVALARVRVQLRVVVDGSRRQHIEGARTCGGSRLGRPMGRVRSAVSVGAGVSFERLPARVSTEVIARACEGHAHPLLGSLDGFAAHGIEGALGHFDEVGIDGDGGHGPTVPHVAVAAQA
jgi:hypothetical protein